MYEGEVERSATAKGVKIINTIRAMMYFLVVGVQIVHCNTDGVTCGVMIVSVPLFLGVLDSLLIWWSGRDTTGVKFGAIILAIVSIGVAIDTLVPIYHGPGLLTDYLFFLFYLAIAIIVISIVELAVVAFDLASPKESLDDLRFPSSIRTYEN